MLYIFVPDDHLKQAKGTVEWFAGRCLFKRVYVFNKKTAEQLGFSINYQQLADEAYAGANRTIRQGIRS
jgi:hypothetical protein